MSNGVRAAGGLGAVLGAALFIWSLRAAGLEAVLDGIRRLGAGFLLVLLLGGGRHLVRAAVWRLCLETSETLSFLTAFAAYVAGDALGNVTPFGFLISEPSKIVLVRNRVAPRVSISALTLENLFYSASVALVLIAGTAALLLSFQVPAPIRIASLTTLGATVSASVAVAWIVWTKRPVMSRLLGSRVPQVRDVEDRIFGFVGRQPAKIAPILLLEATYHVTAVAEIWIVLTLITGMQPSLLTSFVLEYVNRTIIVVFQFVPMWLGVDEAGTGLATSVLNLGAAAGVSLALVRKARMLFWTALGIALLLYRGLSVRAVVREADAAALDR